MHHRRFSKVIKIITPTFGDNLAKVPIEMDNGSEGYIQILHSWRQFMKVVLGDCQLLMIIATS